MLRFACTNCSDFSRPVCCVRWGSNSTAGWTSWSCSAPWDSAILNRPSHDLFDDGALGVGVVLDELPILCRQLLLGACVEIAIGGVAAQPVPERQHPVDFRAPGGEDV